MWISGGKSTLYADHGYARRVRHKCNREREKEERKRWMSKFKKSQEREQVQNKREIKMGKWKTGEVAGEGSSRTGGGGASLLGRRGEAAGRGGPDR